MKFSYQWLQDYISGRLPSPEKLGVLLTDKSFEVEEVKKIGSDWLLDIDILPNRAADCLSHIGVAREVSAITGKKLKLPEAGFRQEERRRAGNLIKLKIGDKAACRRYAASIIFGVKVKESPQWMRERLRTCGLKPINNIVDITNYVMLETGQPLHAFDFDRVATAFPGKGGANPKTIIVRPAKKGEEIKALDNKTYKLDNDVLLIADREGPLAIAGVKGGERPAIGRSTTNIIVEAANFSQSLIRKASQKTKLKTDASWRFENGIDPNLVDFAQKRALSLIQSISGGTVEEILDYYPEKARPKKIKLDLNYLKKLLGVKIGEKEAKEILNRLCFRVKNRGVGFLEVETPTRRLDISSPEDLIEEIGRIYGYQNIPLIFPQAALIPPERNQEIFWEREIKKILKEKGFSETYNYSFIGEKEKGLFGWKGDKIIELENPISSYNKYLRPSLIPNLLKDIKENLKFFPEVKIFELGKIFFKKRKISERKMLSAALIRKGIGDSGFYELKGVVDSLLNGLGISDIWYDDYQPTPEESSLNIWHSGKRAEIKSEGREIGFLGEIHPLVSEEMGIKEKIFVFDINFEKLLKLVSEEQEYRPISFYPEAARDIAVLVPRGVKTVDILNVINAAGGSIVRDVDLFDIYSGEEIGQGKENFAFHIIYQSDKKTLSPKEIDSVQGKIIKALEEKPEWEVRK